MLEEVLAFQRKMTVFTTDVHRGILYRFSFLKKFQKANNQLNIKYFHRATVDMQTGFVDSVYFFPSTLWLSTHHC